MEYLGTCSSENDPESRPSLASDFADPGLLGGVPSKPMIFLRLPSGVGFVWDTIPDCDWILPSSTEAVVLLLEEEEAQQAEQLASFSITYIFYVRFVSSCLATCLLGELDLVVNVRVSHVSSHESANCHFLIVQSRILETKQG